MMPKHRSDRAMQSGRGFGPYAWKQPLLMTLSTVTWLVLAPSTSAQLARLQSVTSAVPGESGQVELKRAVWSTFYSTAPRTALYGDDLLRVSPGTIVELLCPDLTVTDNVRAGESSVNEACPGTPNGIRDPSSVSETWSALDDSIPFVISPWDGRVLTPTPALRWNPVEGAHEYDITLQKQELGDTWSDVWTVTREGSTSLYPEDQSGLESGEKYRVIVTADTGASSLDGGTPPTSFRLIPGEEREPAAAAIARINDADTSNLIKTLILVEDVYPNFQLFSQGINDLLAAIASGDSSPQIHRLLGDYYLRIGLARPAKTAYLTALSGAIASGQLEEQVLAEWGLGMLYGRIDREEQAKRHLECARLGATALGDSGMLSSIEEAIASLE
ncbi:MAG: hypothetical protein WBA10_13390 [Elainellaceae cyanobacterium]